MTFSDVTVPILCYLSSTWSGIWGCDCYGITWATIWFSPLTFSVILPRIVVVDCCWCWWPGVIRSSFGICSFDHSIPRYSLVLIICWLFRYIPLLQYLWVSSTVQYLFGLLHTFPYGIRLFIVVDAFYLFCSDMGIAAASGDRTFILPVVDAFGY